MLLLRRDLLCTTVMLLSTVRPTSVQCFGDLQSRSPSRRSSSTAMSNLSYPKPTVFQPPRQQTSSLIFMHGLGDSANGWADVAEFELAPRLPNTKIILPTAPQRRITLNMGMQMRGWFDLYSLDKLNDEEDAEGLHESLSYVESLIAEEVTAGVPSSRILVGGFSQGGAMALLSLRSAHKLAGVLVMSGYLPLRNGPGPIVSPANAETPVLMLHGDADPTVQYKFGQMSYNLLKQAGANIEMKTYMGLRHSVNPAELSDMVDFVAERLKE